MATFLKVQIILNNQKLLQIILDFIFDQTISHNS